jgi:hypothetical protein
MRQLEPAILADEPKPRSIAINFDGIACTVNNAAVTSQAKVHAPQEIGMRRIAILLAVCAFALSAAAQTPAAAPENATTVPVAHLIGFQSVANNAKGTLTIEGDKLYFAGKDGKRTELALGAIDNIQTADDSRRLVGGFIGTLSMFGPYGSGRFLSLFRKQIDVITIEYRDANNGLHGAIFTLADGAAKPLKERLVSAGAKAEALPPEPAKTEEKK